MKVIDINVAANEAGYQTRAHAQTVWLSLNGNQKCLLACISAMFLKNAFVIVILSIVGSLDE